MFGPTRHPGAGSQKLALVVWCETTTTVAAMHYRRLAAMHYRRLYTVTSSGRYYLILPAIILSQR